MRIADGEANTWITTSLTLLVMTVDGIWCTMVGPRRQLPRLLSLRIPERDVAVQAVLIVFIKWIADGEANTWITTSLALLVMTVDGIWCTMVGPRRQLPRLLSLRTPKGGAAVQAVLIIFAKWIADREANTWITTSLALLVMTVWESEAVQVLFIQAP